MQSFHHHSTIENCRAVIVNSSGLAQLLQEVLTNEDIILYTYVNNYKSEQVHWCFFDR